MGLEEILEQVDIVEYISQFVDLEERNGEYWGLSPFKDENTPSFSVRRETGSYYDFSSGSGGNCYSFIKAYFKCSNKEAVSILKKYIGIENINSPPKKKLAATLQCKKYAKPVKHEKEIKTTTIAENYMDRYEVRDDKLDVWRAEGISDETLKKFQVKYDDFANRLVYPIRNLDGKIVNIGGRTLDLDWKEKKLRKYNYYFPWGRMTTIYGLYDNLEDIINAHEVILFEGCKSVLIADTWGIKNTAAILTSHLNPDQMKALARLGCDVVFALDKDVRIKDDHNIAKLKSYVNVSYIWDRADLLGEKDSPVDKGWEVFETLYKQRLKYR